MSDSADRERLMFMLRVVREVLELLVRDEGEYVLSDFARDPQYRELIGQAWESW